MNAKVKAEELYRKFSIFLPPKYAKRCCQICADEISETVKDCTGHSAIIGFLSALYPEELKEEVNKLPSE